MRLPAGGRKERMNNGNTGKNSIHIKKGTVKLHLIADAGQTVAIIKKEVFENHFKPF